MRKQKKLDYTFLIICEGENTEPLFFKSIKDKIIEGEYIIAPYSKEEIKITIRPEPKDDSDLVPSIQSPHKPKRNNKKLKKIEGENDLKIPSFPLNFIREGQQELNELTYNEVWAVFDHDNHPARKEAFEESENLINGEKVKIAFSSIAFEYYLLLHFERLYNSFTTSECRETKQKNKKPFYCGTGEHANDCDGNFCIGGYARKRGYWQESKGNDSTFSIIEKKFELGFINSAWLRFESLSKDVSLPIYNRNPYTTTDMLVKRICGYDSFKYEWFDNRQILKIEEIELRMNDSRLSIKNISKNRIHNAANAYL